jgi:hypothetical protein
VDDDEEEVGRLAALMQLIYETMMKMESSAAPSSSS